MSTEDRTPIELFGVSYDVYSIDDFTPSMNLMFIDFMSKFEDIPDMLKPIEAGLILTHHPKSKRSLTYDNVRGARNKKPLSQDELTELMQAGTAVLEVITKAFTKKADPEADTPKD